MITIVDRLFFLNMYIACIPFGIGIVLLFSSMFNFISFGVLQYWSYPLAFVGLLLFLYGAVISVFLWKDEDRKRMPKRFKQDL